jgi:hypothetical protein
MFSQNTAPQCPVILHPNNEQRNNFLIFIPKKLSKSSHVCFQEGVNIFGVLYVRPYSDSFDKKCMDAIMPVVRYFREGGTAMLKISSRNNMMMCACTEGSSPDLAGA